MRGQINKQQWVSMIILAAIGRRFSGMRMMSWPICRWFPVAIGNGGFAVAIFVIWRICQFLETLNIYHKSYIYWQLWLNHQPCVCWSNPKKAQAAEYIWVPFFWSTPMWSHTHGTYSILYCISDDIPSKVEVSRKQTDPFLS